MTSGDFCLKWNDHHSAFFTSAEQLCSSSVLCDVSLSAGGRFFQAHKLVLSICSAYFQKVFSQPGNPAGNTTVHLKDVEPRHIELLLSFMYRGEINVEESELMSLLATASELQVKGLSQIQETRTQTSSGSSSSSPSSSAAAGGGQPSPEGGTPAGRTSRHQPPENSSNNKLRLAAITVTSPPAAQEAGGHQRQRAAAEQENSSGSSNSNSLGAPTTGHSLKRKHDQLSRSQYTVHNTSNANPAISGAEKISYSSSAKSGGQLAEDGGGDVRGGAAAAASAAVAPVVDLKTEAGTTIDLTGGSSNNSSSSSCGGGLAPLHHHHTESATGNQSGGKSELVPVDSESCGEDFGDYGADMLYEEEGPPLYDPADQNSLGAAGGEKVVKAFPCGMCEMSFNQKWLLKRHWRTHTRERPFRCSLCNRTFSLRDSCIRHIRTVHKGDIDTGEMTVNNLATFCQYEEAAESLDTDDLLYGNEALAVTM